MSTNFSNRRRNYYIKKEFQRNFILKFCALVVAGSLISGTIIYVMSKATMTTTFENSRLMIKSTADYILPMVFFGSAVVLVLIGIATVIITLLTSHKIAGALFAIEKHVDEVAKGNLKAEFHLRSGDQIKPLAVGLGVMVSNLRAGVKEIKRSASELDTAVAASFPAGIPPEIKNKLEELKSKAGIFTT